MAAEKWFVQQMCLFIFPSTSEEQINFLQMCALVKIILLFPFLKLIEPKIVCEVSHYGAFQISGLQLVKQISALSQIEKKNPKY